MLSLVSSAAVSAVSSVPMASIPSPDVSYIQVGPLRIHFYALCILAGIAVCLWLSGRRWAQMGGTRERVYDVAMWAIPAGIVGARAYHVLITDPGSYFGPKASGDPLAFLKIWEGGIGIMGAVSVGALGAWYACRRYRMNFAAFADAVAPGIILAQAFGRWGNWFNQELFGKPTTLPWGLQIDANSPNFPSQYPAGTLFHPTFLYESLWNLLGAFLLIYLGKKGVLKLGQTLWLYVLYYGVGRLFIEAFLRIDTSEMLLGLRIHVWTAGLLVVLGLTGFIVAGVRASAKAAAGVTDGPVEERGTAENPSDVLETGSKDTAEDDAASTGEKADDKKKAAKKTENTSNVSSAKDISKAKAANNSAAETSGEAQDRPSQPKEEITNDSDGS